MPSKAICVDNLISKENAHFSEMAKYIDEDKAWKFVEESLKIDNARSTMKRDKLGLLNSMIMAFHNMFTLHNVAHVIKPRDERTAPTMAENIEYATSGFGGLCWSGNTAMLCIMGAIGYDVDLIIAKGDGADGHVIVVANNVQVEGDAYLAEFCVGEPAFHAISLDFVGETEVFYESYRSYKLVRDGDTYTRVARSRNPRRSGKSSWKTLYSFTKKSWDIEEAAKRITETVYRNPDNILSQSFRLVRFHDGKLIAMKDNLLLVENSQHQLESKVLETDEEIIATMVEHFPQIPVAMATKAVAAWREEFCHERDGIQEELIHVLQG